MYLRNPMFNELTPSEASFLEARMRSAYCSAGALFTRNRYSAVGVRRDLLEIIDDLSPAY